MDTNESAAERKERLERRISRDGMRFLTGGLTSEGDTFLIAVGAVVVFMLLYPLLGGWALLSFPILLAGAVLARLKLRQRREPAR